MRRLLCPSLLNDSEKIVASQRMLALLDGYEITFEYLNKTFLTLKKAVETLEAAMRRESASEITGKIEEVDKQITRVMKGLNKGLDFNSFSSNAEKRNAAAAISEVIKRVGEKLETKPYAEQSANLKELVNSLKADSIKPHIELLDLTTWLIELETYYHEFEELHKLRVIETDETITVTLKQARPIITEEMELVYDNLRALERNFKDQFPGFTKKVEDVIKPLMTTARIRRAKQKNKTEEKQKDKSDTKDNTIIYSSDDLPERKTS